VWLKMGISPNCEVSASAKGHALLILVGTGSSSVGNTPGRLFSRRANNAGSNRVTTVFCDFRNSSLCFVAMLSRGF